MKKEPLTCADCKYSLIEDLFGEWCCTIKDPNYRYTPIPVTKYNTPYTKCKKFKR